MTITITKFVRLIGYQKVYFHSACGDAAGAWQGTLPTVQGEYTVECDVKKPVRWKIDLHASESTEHSLRLHDDMVVLVGKLTHYHDDIYTLGICDGLINVTVEGEIPEIPSLVTLSVPFYKLALYDCGY